MSSDRNEDGTLTAAAEREWRARIQDELRRPTKGTVYISGPMTGYPESNYPAFNEAAQRWRAEGWEVLNPAENFDGRADLDYATYIREDMKMLLRADTIAMLPGWPKSKGAKWELHTAQLLGLKVLSATNGRELHWRTSVVASPDWHAGYGR